MLDQVYYGGDEAYFALALFCFKCFSKYLGQRENEGGVKKDNVE